MPLRLGPHALGRLRVWHWLAAIAVGGFAIRLAWLGHRVIHFDEARVGLAVLAYLETGEWLYFPGLHGPLLFHLDRLVFGLVGASDAVFRLPVAVVGGLLPLAAWLYRDHLDDAEVVCLGLVLATSPALLYYSRVARNDLLVAAFMIVVLGCALRLRATGRQHYLYLGTAALALGLASKENALLYLLSWFAAGALVVWRSPAVRWSFSSFRAVAVGRARSWALPVALAVLELLVLVVALFAPRGGNGPRLGGVASPADAVAVVDAATVGAAKRVVTVWLLGGGHGPGRYLLYLGLLLVVLLTASLPVVVAATVGAAAERRRSAVRPLVAFCLMWALLGVVGYPLATDVMAGWIAVHVVVALAVPAAVGLAALAASARSGETPVVRRRAATVLVVLVVATAGIGVWTSYAAPGSPTNPLSQPGQASTDLRATLATAERVAGTHEGPDVAYYGTYYGDHPLWRLPFRWYLDRAGATASRRWDPETPPPVVIALETEAEALAGPLDGYACRLHDPYPWRLSKPGGRLTRTVVYVDREALGTEGAGWLDPVDCAASDPHRGRPIGALLDDD